MPGRGPTPPGPDDDTLAVTLDANIIYPMALCDYLLWAAQRYVFRPGWSRPILDEAERNLVAKGTPNAPRRMQRMREAFEDAYQSLRKRIEAFLALPLETMSRDEALAAARRIHTGA